MDDWVRKILTDWNLPQFIPAFEDEEIDRDSFECLTEESIKKMIPKAQPQSIFLRNWREKYQNNEAPSLSDNDIINNDSNNIVFSEYEDDNISMSSTPTDFKTVNAFPVVAMDCVETLSSAGPSCINESNFTKIDTSDLSGKLCKPVTNLIETLKDSVEGLVVLHYYRSNHDLTPVLRGTLVDVILNIEMRTNAELHIIPQRFLELTNMILEIFPTEIRETYYVPYRYDNTTSEKNFASGKFQNRYHHFRGMLINAGLIKKFRGQRKKQKTFHNPVRLGFAGNFMSVNSTEDVEKKFNALKTILDPIETVEIYWKETSKRRIKALISNEFHSTNCDYLDIFPALKNSSHGLNLIDIDFKTEYPNKASKLFEEYYSFDEEIINLCNNKKKKDKKIQELLKLITKEDTKIPEDTRSAVIFLILPLLLPCPPVVYNKTNKFRADKPLVQAEFLLHAKDERDLSSKLSNRKDIHRFNGLSLQPIPVVVGESLYNLNKFYVVIDDISYEAKSTLDAIDKAFKSCYSLQLDFSKIAMYVWQFVQFRIYDMKGETDDIRSPVLELMHDLQRRRF